MPYFLRDGVYSTGDTLPGDVPVPERPDPTYEWNGSAWVATTATAVAQAQAQYNAAIAAGLAITSTGTPALNGTYSIAPANISDIQAEVQFIAAYSEFTNGTTDAMPWADAAGAIHKFTSTAQFMAFAKSAAQYVSALKLALATAESGGTPTWPSNAITIA